LEEKGIGFRHREKISSKIKKFEGAVFLLGIAMNLRPSEIAMNLRP
jgi:hypothetical protein